MKNPSSAQGFTRKELLAVLVLAFILLWGIYQSVFDTGVRHVVRVSSTAKTGHAIQTMLSAWAQDNNGAFPTAREYSNEAFRELFKARLVDSEKLWAIQGDPWHKASPAGDGQGPDNEIGSAPDFAQALMPGECAWAYVSGLHMKSDPELPLLANGFSESIGVYTADKARKGGIFGGKECAWVTVAGSGKVGELSPDFKLQEIKNGQKTDVFGEAWGTKPGNIKNPAG